MEIGRLGFSKRTYSVLIDSENLDKEVENFAQKLSSTIQKHSRNEKDHLGKHRKLGIAAF
jgi:molybdate-binding protein